MDYKFDLDNILSDFSCLEYKRMFYIIKGEFSYGGDMMKVLVKSIKIIDLFDKDGMTHLTRFRVVNKYELSTMKWRLFKI